MMYFFIGFALYLVLLFILRFSLHDFSRECPHCKKGTYKRFPKTSADRLLNAAFLGIIKVKRYECDVCGSQLLRARGVRRNNMNTNLLV